MLKFILKRLFEAVPVLWIVITITFFLIRIAPGGPFDSERSVSPEILQNIQEKYRLNDPVLLQYWNYLKDVGQGDLGPSYKYSDRSVNEMIINGMPITFELGFYAVLFALLIGVGLGTMAGLKPNSVQDYIPMSISMMGICMPSFLLGPLLVLIFSIGLGWFPVSGWDSAAHKILPSITLGASYAAYIGRLTRSGMIEIMSQDFIRTARAKGMPERYVVIRHALKGALVPVISFLGPAIAGLLAGSFVVETIFQIPGLGRFYVQAAFNRDYTMIMGTTVFLAALIVFFNLVSDLLQAWVNPKLRQEMSV